MANSDNNLRDIYISSHITDSNFVWSGPNAQSLPLKTPVHIITAWNPLGRLLSLQDNKQRNQSLLNELSKFDVQLKPVIGHSAPKDWQEESFAIYGLTRKQACEIADMFHQRGIFELSENELLVIDTNSQNIMRQRAR